MLLFELELLLVESGYLLLVASRVDRLLLSVGGDRVRRRGLRDWFPLRGRERLVIHRLFRRELGGAACWSWKLLLLLYF